MGGSSRGRDLWLLLYDVYVKTPDTLIRDRLKNVPLKDLIVDNEISKRIRIVYSFSKNLQLTRSA